jgi:hypothetical protein
MVKFHTNHLLIIVAIAFSIRLLFLKDLQFRLGEFAQVETDSVTSSVVIDVQANQSTSSCRRTCGHRINKIIYTADTAAGLRDRQAVLTLLADLAGYLCAVVEFPPPIKLLTPKHNKNQRSHPNTVWTDYWNLTFIEDGQPSTRTLPVIDGSQGSNSKYSNLGNEKYKDWYYVLTESPQQAYHDFEKVEQSSWRFSNSSSTGFVWEIRANWYPKVDEVMREGLKTGNQSSPHWKMLPSHPKYKHGQSCRYIMEGVPNHVQGIVDDIKDLIENQSDPNATIGFFHVRRGDSMAACNTSLTRMESYLQCTFQGGIEKDRENVTILFLSDEKDERYRYGIRNIVEDLHVPAGEPAGHAKFIDLDKLVWNRLQQVKEKAYLIDNYYVFWVMDVLKIQYGSFYLEQRRNLSCKDCDIIQPL